MVQALLELFEDFQLLLGEVQHDLEVPEDAFDLALKFTFFSDVEKRYDEIAEAVINVRMRQTGEDSGPFPVLLRAKGMLGGLTHRLISRWNRKYQ